jgi:predicted metal-dependent hydrolase
LVHKLTGHGIIGGALTASAALFFNKKFKIAIKRWAKVYQKITKNIEPIFAVQKCRLHSVQGSLSVNF